MIFLNSNTRSLKMLSELLKTLESSVSDFTNLFRIEKLPSFTVESVVKTLQSLTVLEVDECITHIALVLEIDWQIKEIVFLVVSFLYCVSQHLLGVLVRNILNHERSSSILKDLVRIDRELSNFLLGIIPGFDSKFLTWTRNHNFVVLFDIDLRRDRNEFLLLKMGMMLLLIEVNSRWIVSRCSFLIIFMMATCMRVMWGGVVKLAATVACCEWIALIRRTFYVKRWATSWKLMLILGSVNQFFPIMMLLKLWLTLESRLLHHLVLLLFKIFRVEFFRNRFLIWRII